MIVSLRLQNYRSYQDESFEFEPGVNIVVGPNASGKTNLLEAILIITRGSSYRGSDQDVITKGSDWARLDGVYLDNQQNAHPRTAKIRQDHTGIEKQFELDDKPFKRLGPERMLPVVVFEPNHLQLITTSPEQRRNLLDNILELTELRFGALKRNYLRALAQRNAFLKQHPNTSLAEIFPWNVRLSDLGGHIATGRQTLIETFNETLSETYSSIAKQPHKVRLEYVSKVTSGNYASGLLKLYEKHHQLDCLRGFTGDGPHRDDARIFIDGTPIQEAASRGETRTLLLSLKVREAEMMESARGIKPLLLLDDVFGELDGARRHALTEFLTKYQTFITTTDADIVSSVFARSSKIIALN